MRGRKGGCGWSIRLLTVSVLSLCLTWNSAAAFDMTTVAGVAQRLAQEPFHDNGQVPEWLLKISYDQWRDVRFRPEQALWHGKNLPFQVQFFHPGLYYNKIVVVNVVDAKGGVHPAGF